MINLSGIKFRKAAHRKQMEAIAEGALETATPEAVAAFKVTFPGDPLIPQAMTDRAAQSATAVCLRLGNVMADRLGFTNEQRWAATRVFQLSPASLDGYPVPSYDVALVVARHLGYDGPDHPEGV